MGFIRTALIIVVLGLVVHRLGKCVLIQGFHKHVYNHTPGPCRLVGDDVQGSEDIQTLSNGLALISSGFKLSLSDAAWADIEGTFYVFDFNDPEAGLTRVKVNGGEVVSPHGLSVWEDPSNGDVTVFVVNHASTGDRVEKLQFDMASRTLTHLETIEDPLFLSLNDVLATGPDTFYATNVYGTSANKAMQLLQLALLLHQGNLVFYNSIRAHTVADGFGLANGVNMSPDGKFLYVSSFTGETIDVFERSLDNNIKWNKTIQLHTLVDNIDVHPQTGDLWVGAHPIMHRFIGIMNNPNHSAPSQVIRLKMKDGAVSHMEEVYADDGSGPLHGSSVANYYKGGMLIGSVSHKILYCKVPHLTN